MLPELVARSARRVPDTVALIYGDDRRSFAELEERANRLANALAERGVRAGDHVALLMYNRIEFVETFLAIQKLGACAVPVNFRLVPEELEYVLADSRSVGIVTDPELAELAAGTDPAFQLTAGTPSYEDALAAAPADDPGVLVDDDQLAFLMYTSGTTGRPKGAMLTHQNLVVNTLNWIHEVGASADDVWLSGLPLFHIGGLNGVLPFLQLGATTIVIALDRVRPRPLGRAARAPRGDDVLLRAHPVAGDLLPAGGRAARHVAAAGGDVGCVAARPDPRSSCSPRTFPSVRS